MNEMSFLYESFEWMIQNDGWKNVLMWIIGGILISAGLVSGYRACILYHPMEDKPI